MTHYSKVPKTRKYFKELDFGSFARNLSKKYKGKLFGIVPKNKTRCPKNYS